MARSILPANSVTEPVKKKSVATAASPAKKDSVKPAPAVVVDHKPNPLESIGTWFVEFGDNARVLRERAARPRLAAQPSRNAAALAHSAAPRTTHHVRTTTHRHLSRHTQSTR